MYISKKLIIKGSDKATGNENWFRANFLNNKTFLHNGPHFSEVEIFIFVYISCRALPQMQDNKTNN